MLGMHDVPVGIGSDGGCIDHQKDKIEAAYIPPRFSEGALALEPGRELLRRYIYIHYIYIYITSGKMRCRNEIGSVVSHPSQRSETTRTKYWGGSGS